MKSKKISKLNLILTILILSVLIASCKNSNVSEYCELSELKTFTDKELDNLSMETKKQALLDNANYCRKCPIPKSYKFACAELLLEVDNND